MIAGFVTSYVTVTIQHRGRVLGAIQDVNGSGFDEESLFLENSTTRIPGRSLSQDGRFEIQGVRPGEYLMYMEFKTEDVYESPKYYYPGTFDARLAKKIKVVLREVKRDVTFELPTEFIVQKLSGTVVTPNGNPAQAYLLLLPNLTRMQNKGVRPQMYRRVMADKMGRFSFNVIKPFSYWLLAWGAKDDGTPICSKPFKIMTSKDSKGVKQMLTILRLSVPCTIPNSTYGPSF